MKMQEEMARFGGQGGMGQIFNMPAMGNMQMGTAMGQTYTYGPSGELIPKY